MILVGNGRLITRDPNKPYIDSGAVVIRGNKVLETGPYNYIRDKYPEAEFIDADGGIIMPGLINAHAHIYKAIALGLYIDGNHQKNYAEAIDGTWWSSDRRLSIGGIKACAYAIFLDSIRNGVTTVFVNHASFAAVPDSLFAIKDAANELGIRLCLCYEVSERNGSRKCDEIIRENSEYAAWSRQYGKGMTVAMFGVHGLYTVSDGTLQKITSGSRNETGCHVHFSDRKRELTECLNNYGCRPVERLMNNGIIGDKTVLANCSNLHQSELDLIVETGTMVVCNPESQISNAEGRAATLRMLKKGVLIGLGSDTYSHDMIESLKTANLINRHDMMIKLRSEGEVLKILSEDTSRLASRIFNKPLGVLKPGTPADIIVMDYKPYFPFSYENADIHLTFGMNGRCCRTTIINGKLIYHNRKFIKFDEDEINEKILIQSRKLWARMSSRDYL